MVRECFCVGLALMFLLSLSACGTSIQTSDPQAPGVDTSPKQKDLGGEEVMPDPNDSLGEVKIKVFPHIGEYTVPQGTENSITQLSLVSAGSCFYDGSKVAAGKKMHYQVSDLKHEVIVECSQPIQLIRFGDNARDFQYSGKIILNARKKTNGVPYIEAVNQISFEKYLMGVVPTEVPASWHVEALKAQAIAARTYAYFEIKKSRLESTYEGFDIDDTVLYQAYEGLKKSDPRTDLAVVATQDLIMTYQGKVIKAWFSSDAGGRTEDAQEIFGVDAPYCKGKLEPFDSRLLPFGSWSRAISFSSLRSATQFSGAKELQITERFPSGRVKMVEAVSSAHQYKGFTGQDMEEMFSLRSNYFEVSHTANGFVLNGKGFGHGVGMSQWGSQILANTMNWSGLKILDFYYSGIKICSIGRC